MQISIASEEAAMLREILEAKRVDLLKEIAHTDSRGFRDLLTRREVPRLCRGGRSSLTFSAVGSCWYCPVLM
jgi:hypothetical protein